MHLSKPFQKPVILFSFFFDLRGTYLFRWVFIISK